LTEAQQQQNPDSLAETNGREDLEDGIDSPEARSFQKQAGTLTSDQLRERATVAGTFDLYEHGTHVGGSRCVGIPPCVWW
jgi:hypothetical protein